MNIAVSRCLIQLSRSGKVSETSKFIANQFVRIVLIGSYQHQAHDTEQLALRVIADVVRPSEAIGLRAVR